MFLNHVALVCSSEDNSDRFYQGVLGLEKTGSRVLPADLSRDIFKLDEEYRLINYEKGGVKFEIFVTGKTEVVEKGVSHVCIDVENREMFLQRCSSEGVTILRIPRGESVLVFIEDFDGNRFEVKEKI